MCQEGELIEYEIRISMNVCFICYQYAHHAVSISENDDYACLIPANLPFIISITSIINNPSPSPQMITIQRLHRLDLRVPQSLQQEVIPILIFLCSIVR